MKIRRLVIELKRDANPKVVINNLFKHTQLEVTFSVNALAIDHGRPKTLNLKEMIQCYIEHRREVVLRRTRFELRKAEERAETAGRLSHRAGQHGRVHPHHPQFGKTAMRPASSCSPLNSRRAQVEQSAFSSATKRG